MDNNKSKITLKEIADKAGASISVVSRTLRNKPTSVLISEETKSKILETAIEMGWRRNSNIGVVAPDNVIKSDSYFLPCLAGIFHEANKFGNGIFIGEFSSASTDDKIEIPDFIYKKEISGVALMHSIPQKLKEYLDAEKIPFLVLNPMNPQSENCIILNDYGLFMDLLLHLKEQGYKRYYYISFDANSNYTRETIKAFDDFLATNKFLGKIMLSDEKSFSGILRETSEFVKNSTPDTVFISDARFWTVKLLEFFTLHGKAFSGNAGIVGHQSIAEVYYPQLTSIKQPLFDMGKLAIEMINKLWENKKLSMDAVTMKGALNIRESTLPVASGN